MNTTYTIDINCDLGEGSTSQDCINDALLMPYISSCNIACGGHAGNESTMRKTLLNAKKFGLRIGAHPGYQDEDNFGRKSISISWHDLEKSLKRQIDSLISIAMSENLSIQHIKFHGALYNDIEQNSLLADQISNLVLQTYPSLKVVGLAGGELQKACKRHHLEFIAEGFIDRTYCFDGSVNGKLTPRTQPGALINDLLTSTEQARSLATHQAIKTIDKHTLTPKVDTLCLHGDNPDALSVIRAINDAFKQLGIKIQ